MAAEYSVDVCRRLEQKFRSAELHRPMRVARYDAGTELVYDVEAVEGTAAGRVHLTVERFVGGGFAGQVYKVKTSQIEPANKPIGPIEPGGLPFRSTPLQPELGHFGRNSSAGAQRFDSQTKGSLWTSTRLLWTTNWVAAGS
jgi:hypothetical protein